MERNLALASALVGEPLPYVPPGFPTSATDKAEAAARLEALTAIRGQVAEGQQVRD